MTQSDAIRILQSFLRQREQLHGKPREFVITPGGRITEQTITAERDEMYQAVKMLLSIVTPAT